jgi:hypothetical protein
MSWRDDSKPKWVGDPELRAGVTVTFMSDEPEIMKSKYNKPNGDPDVSYVFDVKDGSAERKLRAPKGLRKVLMNYENLEGRTFKILRKGDGFKTTYDIEEIGGEQ